MRTVGLMIAGVLVVQGLPAAAQSGGAGSFRQTMANCEAIGDTNARLSCFDSAARQPRAMPDTAFATPENPADRQKKDRALFGLFGGKRDDQVRKVDPAAPPEVKEVSAEVLARAQTTPGSWLVVLRDAGTWKTETNMAFQPPKVGSSAKIRKSSFGGFLLDVGSQSSIRVTRLN